MTQFRRAWAVTVGTLRVAAPMRVAFEVERSVRSTPNTATVRIWNLTRDRQAEIEQAAAAQVIVEAGYLERGPEQIFRGELFRARGGASAQQRTARDGFVDVVTTVEARDGGLSYRDARISQSFQPGATIATVVRALARAMGVGEGNIAQALAGVEWPGGGATFAEGTTLTGAASRELTRILAALDLRWSVQHGALQVLQRRGALRTQAIRLSPETGLVGAPEVGTRGRVTATALFTPDLWPGRAVVLESERVAGRYIAREVRYSGDSHSQAWYATASLVPEAA